jgi:hypothetical protein
MTEETHTEFDRTNPDYDALVAFLEDRFEDDLRWVASFNADTYRYEVRYIRPDLTTELSTHDLDVVVHRSIALFNRPYVGQVYAHLGEVRSLVLQHERATAVHLYLGESDGIVVKIRAGNDVGVPGFVEECLAVLYGSHP